MTTDDACQQFEGVFRNSWFLDSEENREVIRYIPDVSRVNRCVFPDTFVKSFFGSGAFVFNIIFPESGFFRSWTVSYTVDGSKIHFLGSAVLQKQMCFDSPTG